MLATTYAGPVEIAITGTQRITKTYFTAAAKLVAMRVITTSTLPAGTLYFLLSDHPSTGSGCITAR